MSDINNMSLWNDVCRTDPSTVKDAKVGGRKITAIDAQIQRKNATSKFGPYGIGWGVEPESEIMTHITIGTTELIRYHAVMFYNWDGKTGRLPINADIKMAYVTNGGKGYLSIDDEHSKKVATNALTKGLSMLGFNSDVFEKKFDDCKYVNVMRGEFAYINADQVSEIDTMIESTKTDKIKFLQYMKSESVGAIPQDAYQIAITALKQKARAK